MCFSSDIVVLLFMTLSIDTVSYRLLPRMTGMDVDNKKLGHLKFLTAAGPQKLPKTK